MPRLLPKVLLRRRSVQTDSTSSKISERLWRGFWRIIWRLSANVRSKPQKIRRHPFGNPNERHGRGTGDETETDQKTGLWPGGLSSAPKTRPACALGSTRKPRQMTIDSHGLYSLEPASPVYRVIQAHLSRWQSGFLPGNAPRQMKGSFG
jgi:hypothetical protein